MEFVFRIQKKSRRTRRESRRDTGRSSVLETKRSGMELFIKHLKENGTLSNQEYQCFESWNPEKKNNTDTIHFNADASNTELLFRIIHSVNQLSIYGAVSNWREQFGLTVEEKVQEKTPGKKESVTKSVLTSVQSQEVKLLVSSPRRASGNSLREKIQDFESLSETIRFTRVCEDAIFVRRVSAGMSYKTRPDEDGCFSQISPLCRQYTLSRVNPRSRVFAAIPGGTIIRPVIEVQIVKILDTCGLEIAIPSPNDSKRTSYVMISRGKSRFVDEVHIPNAELRSSAEFLFELQKV